MIIWLVEMMAEMTAGYIMNIWLIEMTAEMTAGYIMIIHRKSYIIIY